MIVLALGWGIFNLNKSKKELETEFNNLESKFLTLEKENKTLAARVEYFKIPENLLKELKAQFNYKEAGEELIIIVPPKTRD